MSDPKYSFVDAARQKCKASIVIEGLSGDGKTGLALILGYVLAGEDWSKVFDIDTEQDSALLYPGTQSSLGVPFGAFKHANFEPSLKYKPSNYKGYKEAAISAGAKVVINDSITHAWNAEGGVLDMVSEKKTNNARYQKDSYAAWGDEEIVKEKQLLMELFRDSRCHVISTVRVKEKMDYDKDANGKTVLVSMGEQQIMQSDMKYEPDLVLSMVEPGNATNPPKARVVKSRYNILQKNEVYEFTQSLCEQIRAYLEEGADPEELLKAQHTEYVNGVKQYLDSHKNAIPVWNTLKENEGCKDVKLNDMPMATLKKCFTALTMD